MALFKYFKRTEGHRETPPSLTTNDIKKANESIAKALEVKGRGKYNTYTPGQRARTTPTCQDCHQESIFLIFTIISS